MNRLFSTFCIVLCLGLCFGGCAKKTPGPSGSAAILYHNQGDEALDLEILDDDPGQPDSLEGLNRGVFSFNDALLTHVFTPINTVYTGFFPPDVRSGFSNFYRNLAFPVRFLNSVLQFKLDKAFKEAVAFVLNTTLGSAGFFNVTKNMDWLQVSPEDFGQTLAFYGVGHGSYLVLPVLGPSSLRDTVGLVADAFASPVTWVQPDGTRYALVGHDTTNTASGKLDLYQELKAESFDHYTSMKDVYFQHRQGMEDR